MLAALLCNQPRTGGVPKGFDEEKANRYLSTLREEHFGREAAKESAGDIQAKSVQSEQVYKINKIMVPSITAVDGVAESDDDLALLLILAEL